jgi:hypothetical protein
MNSRGRRAGLSILVSVGASGLALINLRDSFWPDESLHGRVSQHGGR